MQKRKRSIHNTVSLEAALAQAAEVLELSLTDALSEVIRRGLVVGCPIRPRGNRIPLGLEVNEANTVTTLYETPELAHAIQLFIDKYSMRSYSAAIRVLIYAGLYAYTPDMEQERNDDNASN